MTKQQKADALMDEQPNATHTDDFYESRAYEAKLKDGTLVNFKVPFSDMGDTRFSKVVPAQLLIRWMV